MLPKLLWLVFLAMVATIRFSNATQCSLSTYTQQYDLQEMLRSRITVATLANDTLQQMQGALEEFCNENLVQTNYTVSKTEKSVTVCYNVLYNCNEAVTTVTSSGETKTIAVNVKRDQVRIDQVIQCG